MQKVHLCAVRADDPAVKACADQLYEAMEHSGIEVLYDDRNVSAGVMFSDADLVGVPVRVVVSPRNLKQQLVEITTRDKKHAEKVAVSQALAGVQALISDLFRASRENM